MTYIIRGQWGLNREGFFRSDPWFLVSDFKIIEHGFGKPPAGIKTTFAGDGLIIPGLVNSHTHTELSHLKNKIIGGNGVHGFASNIMKQPKPQISEVVEMAKNEVENAALRGTFYFADISNDPEFIVLMKNYFNNRVNIQSLQFLELLGFREPFDQRRMQMAESFFNSHVLDGDIRRDIRVTPHSVYGSSPDIMKYIQGKNKKIISIHALEDPDEINLFNKKGKTFDFLNSIGQYAQHDDFNEKNYVLYLKKYFRDVEKLLMVHLAFADDGLLKQMKIDLPQSAIVLCHRSNDFLGYERSNWQSLTTSSLPLLIGTDSAATCPDISVLDEILSIIKKDKMPENVLWKSAAYNSYDYFNIASGEIPWFLFRDTTPDVSTLENVHAIDIVQL
ncbi:MAG: amidohydrolase family protein [Spirochaetia bacterium]|nr:amidohydrolase family protein [Spirochaetia bacterium]